MHPSNCKKQEEGRRSRRSTVVSENDRMPENPTQQLWREAASFMQEVKVGWLDTYWYMIWYWYIPVPYWYDYQIAKMQGFLSIPTRMPHVQKTSANANAKCFVS